MTAALAAAAQAQSITINGDVTLTTAYAVVSDANTQAAALPPGLSMDEIIARLNTPDTAGLSFSSALVGAYGTWTPLPPAAPFGTQVSTLTSN